MSLTCSAAGRRSSPPRRCRNGWPPRRCTGWAARRRASATARDNSWCAPSPASCPLPGADSRSTTVPIDPWILEPLEAFVQAHGITVAPSAEPSLAQIRGEHAEAIEAVRRSRSRSAEPLDVQVTGELAPFQWAGVRYALDARRAFLADEQGLGKTVQALAALEADDAFPAVVVCPASLKLNWEREAARWLPQRSRTVVSGRGTAIAPADITI